MLIRRSKLFLPQLKQESFSGQTIWGQIKNKGDSKNRTKPNSKLEDTAAVKKKKKNKGKTSKKGVLTKGTIGLIQGARELLDPLSLQSPNDVLLTEHETWTKERIQDVKKLNVSNKAEIVGLVETKVRKKNFTITKLGAQWRWYANNTSQQREEFGLYGILLKQDIKIVYELHKLFQTSCSSKDGIILGSVPHWLR